MLGLQSEHHFVARVQHADAVRREHRAYDIDDSGLSGVGVPDDKRDDVEAVELPYVVEHPADECEHVGVQLVRLELVFQYSVKQRCIYVVEVTFLIDVVPRYHPVFQDALSDELPAYYIKKAVAEADVPPVAPHERKVDAVDVFHVYHHVVEPPGPLLHGRVVLQQ